jgi:hypothetical protein
MGGKKDKKASDATAKRLAKMYADLMRELPDDYGCTVCGKKGHDAGKHGWK